MLYTETYPEFLRYLATPAGKEIEELADLSPCCLDVAGLCGSHQVLEFGEDLLDRIQVGTVGRQEHQMRALGADGVTSRLALVTAEIVG